MSSKKKPVSLAEKISNLVTAVPKSFGSDDEAEDTKAKVVDYDDEFSDNDDFKPEFNNSSIRKRNLNLLEETDKRYVGKKVSKKEIFDDGGSSEESNEDDADDSAEESAEENLNDESDEEANALESNESDESDDGISNDDEEEDDDEEEENDSDYDDHLDESIDRSNPLRRDRSENGIKTMSATNVRGEIEKGNCVREQLKVWESLLEMRIKLQKCLMNSNKMPQYDAYENYQANDEFKKNCTDAKGQLSELLTNLLQLQNNLLNNFPETKGILAKGKKRKADETDKENGKEEDFMDEEIPSDTEDEINDDEENGKENEEMADESEESDSKEQKRPSRKKMKLSDFENVIAKNHKSYTEYRNSVIQKWNDKTRIASGVITKGVNQPAIKQIEFALTNKDKLLKKTQLKRSEYDIVGKSSVSLEDNDGRRTQEYDTEIFDDDDFYHQLLRELIEYKSADITDPIQLSKQWIQLQNMRSKMKRKIDTRATKGRRLRYNVHQKLVNFMAPITIYDTWTEHSKNELFSSLFGKIKSISQEPKPTS